MTALSSEIDPPFSSCACLLQVDPSTCHYIVDSYHASRRKLADGSSFEPEFVLDMAHWDRLFCAPDLDGPNSGRLQRAFWLPGEWWASKLNWGEYCLLGNKALVNERSAQ